MNRKNLNAVVWLALAAALIFGLSACAAQPKLVASYPAQNEQERPSPDPRSRLVSQFVYDAYIDMQVSNPTRAAERAEELAYDYSGTLVSSQSWTEDGQRHTSLVLAVPAPNFEGLRDAILRLGRMESERVSGRWSSAYEHDWSVYSEITVTFHPKPPALPDFPSIGWNPVETFERAARVFLTVFGFLVDILIWALVVVGPFILMALGLRGLLRRLRLGK